MRILWLATCDLFYDYIKSNSNLSDNNEGGWYTGLHQAIQQYDTENSIELGVAFTCNRNIADKVVIGHCTYYTLKPEKQSRLQRLIYLWGGYKRTQMPWHSRITQIIKDFKPDLIHFFGIESQMAYYLLNLEIPYIVNLLGILTPYHNTFFPINMNNYSVLAHNHTIKELVLNNQLRFAYKTMGVRTIREKELFTHCKNLAGRTEWDRQIANIFAPQAQYHIINEILRPIFYRSQKWKYQQRTQIEIVSTISENPYKGFDLILKTASLMIQLKIPFRWRVMGLSHKSDFTHFFEKHYGIIAQSNGIELLGRMESKELVQTLLDADLFVHPSYIDNSPNSVCEAQYLGIPVVACYVGGIPSLIEHGKSGWLVPSNAPYEIAYLVKNYHTLPIESISAHEIEVAKQRHDPHKIFQEVLSCYQFILNNQGK